MPSILKRARMKTWTPWVGGTLVLAAAALILTFTTGREGVFVSHARAVNSTDITYGPPDAPKILIEYSDFQCQFCAGYSEFLTVLREEYTDKVLFVFRFYPLDNHPYAAIAAHAAYAAYLQGSFWEMHDLLFQNQEEWSAASDPTTYFEAYAQTLGLDVDMFRSDMASEATATFVAAEKAEGKEAGVTHTPWFVVDDVVVTPLSLAEFEELLGPVSSGETP